MASLNGVRYAVAQDEDDIWCAHAELEPQAFAHGDGYTREAALADLADAVAALRVVLDQSAAPRARRARQPPVARGDA
jgi:hypothetical protein